MLAVLLAAALPSFAELSSAPVRLRPALVGVHPRVFVTAAGLEELRRRARTTHRAEWQRVLDGLVALRRPPPPAPGPQERRSQNDVALAISEMSLAFAVERRPEYLDAARRWLLAAIDYEPWGYTYYKPNVDLAAGHLLYAVGWAYDLLWHELSPDERARIRGSLERHARLVHDSFAPAPGKRFAFTQNHDFIPTSGLAVAALALMGESPDAERWAALARAHHHRALSLLSPDGYYYEGFEYWIFAAPWLVHFADGWEHATGESLWELGPFRRWAAYAAHSLLPDGPNVFDFGDVWEGPLTRARGGKEYARIFPGGTLQSNYNVLYRVASRFHDSLAQAVADRLRGFGHSNLEEHWTLLWRDAALAPAPIEQLPLHQDFADSGVVLHRTSWGSEATAFAFKAGPPEGHRALRLQPDVPEWEPSTGHAHPDAGSFIVWAGGRYLTGDTGYAGLPLARHHNTVTFAGVGQGIEGTHDVWDKMPADRLDGIILTAGPARIAAELAGAYPLAAGVDRFQRTFEFDPPGRFRVSDRIELREPRTAAWYLHSDTPFDRRGDAWVTGGEDARLEVRIREPKDARAVGQPTLLVTPGRPGAIETGDREARGYELQVTARASRTPSFDVELRVAAAALRSPAAAPPGRSAPPPGAPADRRR
jgi:hypothetical protein